MDHVSKKTWRWLVSVLVMIACLFIIPLSALAGDGDGTGGGQDEPLALASSSPANGQTGVGLQPVIKLTFTKNVINLSIRDANKKCFSLVSSTGSNVAIEVIMADDQIYPEEKRNVSLKPLQSLQANSTYTVKISPQLQAKSGVSLGREVTIKFTTAGNPADTSKPAPAEPAVPSTVEKQPDQFEAGQPAAGADSSTADKTQTTAVDTNQGNNNENPASSQDTNQKDTVSATKSRTGNNTTESTNPLTQKKKQSAYLWMTAAGVILLVGLGYLFYRKRISK